MRLTPYEKTAQKEVDAWLRGDASLVARAMDWVMRPVDWAVEQGVPDSVVDQMSEAIGGFLSKLNDATKWAVDLSSIQSEARKNGLDIEDLEDLRTAPLKTLDTIANGLFTQNTVMAALSGGGTGLGGAMLIAADIPLLFAINLHLIQRIGAAYGFPMTGPEHGPIVLSIYNAAAASSREARSGALHEVGIAAAAYAGGSTYRGRVRGVFSDQSRHVPRELAKNLVGRKLLQTIPLAGAAVGAGVNYWFTRETAQTSYMLFRALYLEHKDRLQ
ncbi:MAG: EcsC family protein [Rhodothermaceae bacterium]|nr:EcsC family protein [Rhodothermaceae bacterium]MYF40151.1 EcsC family protein [Rhodothermaceae bacterium]MYH08033.1 EcsC family protein [Rhodothermaceae bacterium]